MCAACGRCFRQTEPSANFEPLAAIRIDRFRVRPPLRASLCMKPGC